MITQDRGEGGTALKERAAQWIRGAAPGYTIDLVRDLLTRVQALEATKMAMDDEWLLARERAEAAEAKVQALEAERDEARDGERLSLIAQEQAEESAVRANASLGRMLVRAEAAEAQVADLQRENAKVPRCHCGAQLACPTHPF